MRVLVLGGAGMAGHVISTYLNESGYDVTIFGRKAVNNFPTIVGDASDFSLLDKTLSNSYDVVINCIGLLNESCEENKELAIWVNSLLPHKLHNLCQKNKSKLIHLSTDCVFSGQTGGYDEKSITDGQTFYDRTKALGEVFGESTLTFRQSIIGPDSNVDGIGLFNWFMKQDNQLKGYTNAIWTGVSTITLAKAMDCAIKTNLTGLYHLVNNESISKYDLLQLFNQHVRGGDLIIDKDSHFHINKSLINTRTDFDFIVPSYKAMVVEVKDWILKHSELYPHYIVH